MRRGGRGTGRFRKISIRVWGIMGYGGTRGYDWLHPGLTTAEDERMRASALDKRFRLVEARDEKAERETEELR